MKSLYTFIELIIIIFFVYMGLPSIWYRVFSKFTVKQVEPGTVAITFDDGPDSDNTPKLLDELMRLKLKVTFFVLGSAVENNNDIVRRQIKEGHEVGLHSMNHRCHWFLGPFSTYKDVKLCIKAVQAVGCEPKLYRPPWGLYNLFTVLACKRYGVRCVHWSLHAFDWSASTSTKDIINIMKNKMKSTDVILLHDGRGKENAPQRTLAAISSISDIIDNKDLVNTTLNSKVVKANE